MQSGTANIAGFGAGVRGRWIAVLLFGITMAYFEAAVVVYLRAIAYPQGFAFPLAGIAPEIVTAEVGRELASLLMVGATAFLAGGSRAQRFACFLIIFGIWDICYYLFLKLLLDWPASFLTWDVLYLIPVVWAAPVMAPAAVALLMIVLGMVVLRGDHRRRQGYSEVLLPEEAVRRHDFRLVPRELGMIVAGGVLIFISFVGDFLVFALPRLAEKGENSVLNGLGELGMEYLPGRFPWLPYAAGVAILCVLVVMIWRRS